MSKEEAISKVVTVVTTGVSLYQIGALADIICDAYNQGINDAEKSVI